MSSATGHTHSGFRGKQGLERTEDVWGNFGG